MLRQPWDYEEDDVGGEDDVVIMRAHVDEVFGPGDSLAVIEGLWLSPTNQWRSQAMTPSANSRLQL
jgi:hypothetical protein